MSDHPLPEVLKLAQRLYSDSTTPWTTYYSFFDVLEEHFPTVRFWFEDILITRFINCVNSVLKLSYPEPDELSSLRDTFRLKSIQLYRESNSLSKLISFYATEILSLYEKVWYNYSDASINEAERRSNLTGKLYRFSTAQKLKFSAVKLPFVASQLPIQSLSRGLKITVATESWVHPQYKSALVVHISYDSLGYELPYHVKETLLHIHQEYAPEYPALIFNLRPLNVLQNYLIQGLDLVIPDSGFWNRDIILGQMVSAIRQRLHSYGYDSL